MYILSIFIPFLFSDIFIFSVNPFTGSNAEGKRKKIDMSDCEEENKEKRRRPESNPEPNSRDKDEPLKEDKSKGKEQRPGYSYQEFKELTLERDEAKAGYEAFRNL